ncbi:MAG: type IV toxin-antitoxin system AbiEi family antitoxin domain-containing protein [Actinomycetota bacterium]
MLAPIATRQHGLFTVAQAASAGITRGAVDRRVRTGELVAVDYGVYRSALTPRSWHQRLLAACLAGPAVASHRSAAALWNLPVDGPAVLEVTALRHRRRTADEVVWHESYLLDDDSVTEIDGVPVTKAPRTILDLAVVLDSESLERVIDDVLRRRLATRASIGRLLERLGPRRIGSGVVRAALAGRSGHVPESDLETRFEQLIRSHGLPPAVAQLEVVAPNGRRMRIDFAYPKAMVGVEVLGAGFHANPERWADDVERLALLAAMGWHMLSFTYAQVTRHPSLVTGALRRALDR